MSRPRLKWNDIIAIDSQEVGCGRMECIGLGQDRIMGKVGGKRPLSRPRREWDDIMEMDHLEV